MLELKFKLKPLVTSSNLVAATIFLPPCVRQPLKQFTGLARSPWTGILEPDYGAHRFAAALDY